MSPATPVIPGAKPDQHVTFAKNQPEYLPLPAIVYGGVVITRWKLSWAERIAVLLGGSMWLQVLTFGDPLQPLKLSVDCPLSKSDLEAS